MLSKPFSNTCVNIARNATTQHVGDLGLVFLSLWLILLRHEMPCFFVLFSFACFHLDSGEIAVWF